MKIYIEYLRKIETWETKLIQTKECWENNLPNLTQELYDEWMDLQRERNELLGKRGIDNCRLIKSKAESLGKPLTEELNGKTYCQGYQANDFDDEPCTECKHCCLNIFYQT